MKTALISYSLTGNNDALARAVAPALNAKHITVTEQKKRSTGTIMFDLLTGRTPKVSPPAEDLDKNDLVVFVGPVWISMAATPLRPYLRCLKKHPCRYAYVSISGGADDNPNQKLADDLKKRAGRAPEAVVDLHIADLVPQIPKPTREITSAYRLSDDDVKMLVEKVVEGLSVVRAEKEAS